MHGVTHMGVVTAINITTSYQHVGEGGLLHEWHDTAGCDVDLLVDQTNPVWWWVLVFTFGEVWSWYFSHFVMCQFDLSNRNI